VAVGAVLLITSFVDTTYKLKLAPLQVALWAIPTAIIALLIHGGRSLWMDRVVAQDMKAHGSSGNQTETGIDEPDHVVEP